jgi:CheY-like chemotaxis protein
VQIVLADADDVLRAEIAEVLRNDGRGVVECADGPTLFAQLEERLSHPGARRSLVIAQARLPNGE